jgi:hypothetical protein
MQDASQSRLIAIADEFIALYRQMYLEADRLTLEAAKSAEVEAPVASSIDESMQEHEESWVSPRKRILSLSETGNERIR